MLSANILASEPPKTIEVEGQVLYVFTEAQTQKMAAALVALDVAETRLATLNQLVESYEKALSTLTAISARQDQILQAEIAKREAKERELELSEKARKGSWIKKFSTSAVTVVIAALAGALLAR